MARARSGLARPGPKIVEWYCRSALAHFCQVANGEDEVAHRTLEIRLEVAAADDAFLGVEVDQDERPAIEPADLGDDRDALAGWRRIGARLSATLVGGLSSLGFADAYGSFDQSHVGAGAKLSRVDQR